MLKKKVAVVVSHPIQHFCPQYASWARLPGVELKVFFASNHGLVAYKDKNFDRIVKWEGITLDFPHEFLHGAAGKKIDSNIDFENLSKDLSIFLPNVIIVYGYSQRLQRRAINWAKTSKTPILMISDSELRATRNWLKRLVKSVLLPHVYKNINLFLSVGDANEAYYRNYGVKDYRLIRSCFPIDVHHYNSIMSKHDECRSHVRNILGIPTHHKVLLMVGKLVSWKRQVDLVHYSNSIQSARNDITVVFVGTGPDEVALRGLTMRNGVGGVVFAGFVSPEILPKYYCAADVYVHCSEHEPHSLAISEAIYCGLPVVLSDSCGSYGPTDDVRIGLNGFAYRCGDIGDMSRILQYVIGEAICARMSGASLRISRYHQQLAHGAALEQALAVIETNFYKT